MSAIGEVERRTQQRVVTLFIDALHYAYLGNFSDRHNENILRGELEQSAGAPATRKVAAFGSTWSSPRSPPSASSTSSCTN